MAHTALRLLLCSALPHTGRLPACMRATAQGEDTRSTLFQPIGQKRLTERRSSCVYVLHVFIQSNTFYIVSLCWSLILSLDIIVLNHLALDFLDPSPLPDTKGLGKFIKNGWKTGFGSWHDMMRDIVAWEWPKCNVIVLFFPHVPPQIWRIYPTPGVIKNTLQSKCIEWIGGSLSSLTQRQTAERWGARHRPLHWLQIFRLCAVCSSSCSTLCLTRSVVSCTENTNASHAQVITEGMHMSSFQTEQQNRTPHTYPGWWNRVIFMHCDHFRSLFFFSFCLAS